MEKIFWGKNQITITTNEIEACPHSHHMLQLFIKQTDNLTLNINNQIVTGNYIIINDNIRHSIIKKEKLSCFILIDKTSTFALQLKKIYLHDKDYCSLPLNSMQNEINIFLNQPTINNHNLFINKLYQVLQIDFRHQEKYDYRITEVLTMLNNFDCLNLSAKEIANHLFISSSRFSHLFYEQTGITYNSYKVLFKLQKAYLLIFAGKSITTAAHEAGFSSSSHLADVNRKMMGMPITNFLKNSRILEVIND